MDMQTLQQELCQYVWSESLNLHLFIYLPLYIHISWQSVLKEMFFIFLYFKDDFFLCRLPQSGEFKKQTLRYNFCVALSPASLHLAPPLQRAPGGPWPGG